MLIRKRMRRYLAERRKARRHQAEHEVSLIAGVALGAGPGAGLITGRTRDISEKGLSLSLPVTDEQQRALTAVGEAVRILLVLPTSTVNIQGTITRSLPLDERDLERGQLIGVQITQMDAPDQATYQDYLSSLK